jgi:hypothetical protein
VVQGSLLWLQQVPFTHVPQHDSPAAQDPPPGRHLEQKPRGWQIRLQHSLSAVQELSFGRHAGVVEVVLVEVVVVGVVVEVLIVVVVVCA